MARDGCLYSQKDLVSRVADAERPIMFVLGSPLTSPSGSGEPGVPGVAGIVDLIRHDLKRRRPLRAVPEGDPASRYQQGMDILRSVAGPNACDRIMRIAVLKAQTQGISFEVKQKILEGDKDECLGLEKTGDWHLTQGVKYLSYLVRRYPRKFNVIITSNVDPLLEIALADTNCNSLSIDNDARTGITVDLGSCKIVHFHGFWRDSRTFHTKKELTQPRPQLLNSLVEDIKNHICVVIAYSGWDDIFIQALRKITEDNTQRPEIIWSFFEKAPSETANAHTDLLPQFESKVDCYYGVNVHSFMEQLWTEMNEKSSADLPPGMGQPFTWGNLLDHVNGSSPHNLEALWGIDRGCFVGFLEGGRAEKAYQSFVQTENRLLASLRKSINGPGVSTRWWIRLNAGKYASGWEGASDWLANHLDRLGQYGEIPAKASIGLFLDMPLTSNLFIHGHNLNRWIQTVQRIAGSQISFVFHWETAPLQLRSLLADMRALNPSFPIDRLRLDDSDNSERSGANRSVEALFKKDVAGTTGDLSGFSSHEANSVVAYAEGKISEERFIREQGMRAFLAALRAGCHFPEAITFASQIPITATDYWWLVRRLEPTRERLQAILNTDTARRAIWGLCSACEWDSLPTHVKEQINEARENRKLVFSVSSMEKPTC